MLYPNGKPKDGQKKNQLRAKEPNNQTPSYIKGALLRGGCACFGMSSIIVRGDAANTLWHIEAPIKEEDSRTDQQAPPALRQHSVLARHVHMIRGHLEGSLWMAYRQHTRCQTRQ